MSYGPESLSQKQLNHLRGEMVTVFLVSAKALNGILVDFDGSTLILGPDNAIVNRSQVTTITKYKSREAKGE